MARANDDAAALLQEMAELKAIAGEDPFRIRSYEKAAAAVAAYPKDIAELDDHGLVGIPSVGKSMASRLREFLQTGTISDLEALRLQVPAGVREMTRIPGLGPKTAVLLHQQLGIATVEELIAAVKAEKLRGIKGLGAKTEQNILQGIAQIEAHGERVHIDVALDAATAVIERLKEMPEVKEISYAGSLRRMRETIGDIDILIASKKAQKVMDRFVELDLAERVIGHGTAKSSVYTTAGLQVDLRVVSPDAWGAAMIYFTGSKAHNIKIREMAVRKKLKLNEYGLFRLEDDGMIVSRTEAAVYEALGLPFILPTLREDTGEIEAALKGELPNVVVEKDIKGDLHTHTDLTDGHGTLEEMLDAAAARGYEYYAVTDHAGDFMAMQRTTREKMLEQRAKIAKLQTKYPKMRILHGTELNIQPDGRVDYDPEFLRGYDICVASVHSHFNLTKDEQTKRILAAMENPDVHIIGHPSGRQVGRRPAINFDADAVFRAAAKTGTALEINSHPHRLDLKDEHARLAIHHGAPIAIDTDSHAIGHLELMTFGVGTAQRGWVTKSSVINAKTLKQLEAFVAKKRSR